MPQNKCMRMCKCKCKKFKHVNINDLHMIYTSYIRILTHTHTTLVIVDIFNDLEQPH
jgi:hypothetical protein